MQQSIMELDEASRYLHTLQYNDGDVSNLSIENQQILTKFRALNDPLSPIQRLEFGLDQVPFDIITSVETVRMNKFWWSPKQEDEIDWVYTIENFQLYADGNVVNRECGVIFPQDSVLIAGKKLCSNQSLSIIVWIYLNPKLPLSFITRHSPILAWEGEICLLVRGIFVKEPKKQILYSTR